MPSGPEIIVADGAAPVCAWTKGESHENDIYTNFGIPPQTRVSLG